eukprot:CAMPEP_0204912542 /NCGR_PEP_ID=MMETSP1397-20131031/10665_1 /ASSEMBLY_ACC=CAM_ASM_000891 /TAXON_ID=49980 /ORGANISM="Climacostomum Climacostomum virens, Strain Stock W-24" /LENGTH=158 /DNA_ID=CAMNT_0052083519 /DNA_START=696 /DNA_END=1169 /DNA_ORIENTATION=+
MRSFGIVANLLCPPIAVFFKDFLSTPPANYMFLIVFCFCEAVLIGFEVTLYAFETILAALIITALIVLGLAAVSQSLKVKVPVSDAFIGEAIIATVFFAYASTELQNYIRVHLITCTCLFVIYTTCLLKDLSSKLPDIVSIVSVIVDVVGVYLSVIYM